MADNKKTIKTIIVLLTLHYDDGVNNTMTAKKYDKTITFLMFVEALI